MRVPRPAALAALVLAMTVTGCGGGSGDASGTPADTTASPSTTAGPASKSMPGMDKKDMDMTFKDAVASNADAPRSLEDLVFTDTEGQPVRLADYLGEKHVVIVFTEGFSGMLCPFCTTQTRKGTDGGSIGGSAGSAGTGDDVTASGRPKRARRE